MSKDIEIISEGAGVRTYVSKAQAAILKIPHPWNGSSLKGLTLVFSLTTSPWDASSWSVKEDFYEKVMERRLKVGGNKRTKVELWNTEGGRLCPVGLD